MKYVSIIAGENEYFFNENDIEWKDGLKTKTQSNVSSFIVNNKMVVTSSMKIKYICDKCGKEIISKFSNFKNRKTNYCISCIRRENAKTIHINRSEEEKRKLNRKISQKTKEAMSQFTKEKKKEINDKKIKAINWEKRNKKWQKTMSSKSKEERNEIYRKVSESMKKRYEEKGPWNLRKNDPKLPHSAINCEYYTRGLTSTNELIYIKCSICDEYFQTIRMNATKQEKAHPGILQCKKCANNKKSLKEKEILNWIKSYNIKTEENTFKIIPPLEIDIYIPGHNLAIEFNGLYWHSEQLGTPKNYHLNKTKMCEEKGIRLIHIFEDEWIEKQDIVKSRLKNILGLNDHRIGARQTIIKEISPKEKNSFLDTYHIQGHDSCAIKLGAFYNDRLIAVMTFAKNRGFNKKKSIEGVWELSRFATISNTYTPGLASKMLKHFERNYKWSEIYSYADRRWSWGEMYYKLGFKFEYFTQPNYWYFEKKMAKRFHRYKFRKSELKNFSNYSESKTEKQIMDESGWYRIYDCGNHLFIKKAGN